MNKSNIISYILVGVLGFYSGYIHLNSVNKNEIGKIKRNLRSKADKNVLENSGIFAEYKRKVETFAIKIEELEKKSGAVHFKEEVNKLKTKIENLAFTLEKDMEFDKLSSNAILHLRYGTPLPGPGKKDIKKYTIVKISIIDGYKSIDIAQKKDLNIGVVVRQERAEGYFIATNGLTKVKLTTKEQINPGDLLTISDKPGYATKRKNDKEMILGKALETKSTDGEIYVLLNIR